MFWICTIGSCQSDFSLGRQHAILVSLPPLRGNDLHDFHDGRRLLAPAAQERAPRPGPVFHSRGILVEPLDPVANLAEIVLVENGQDPGSFDGLQDDRADRGHRSLEVSFEPISTRVLLNILKGAILRGGSARRRGRGGGKLGRQRARDGTRGGQARRGRYRRDSEGNVDKTVYRPQQGEFLEESSYN